MRKFVSLVFVVGLLGLCFVPFVSADYEYIGITGSGGASQNNVGNGFYGLNVTSTVPAGTWYCINIYAYMHNHSGPAGENDYVKAALYNESGELVHVSDPVLIDTDGSPVWLTFNMTGDHQILDNYVIGIISKTGFATPIHFTTTTNGVRDLTNSYNSPSSIVDGETELYDYCVYAMISDVEGGPTPTPTATATSGGTFTDNSAINALLSQLFWWLAALIIVLGPAFIFGVLFKGGTWGFLIGMLCGSGLGYWLMPTIVPLWLVIGVVFAVAAMAWSVFGRSS